MILYLNATPMADPIPGRYPTKEEILKEPRPLFRKPLFNILSGWKDEFYEGWREKEDKDRFYGLQVLVERICREVYNVEPPEVLRHEFDTSYVLPARGYRNGIIFICVPSILSTLHELGHHLFGKSEYHACRFSVWLYQLRFPNAMKELVWKDHLLVKHSSSEEAE